MRRWIAIFLMIVLPLQLSWAVAANYCQDEQGAAAHHFGHHVHLHHDGADTTKHLAKGKHKADSDCGCSGQLCGAHILPATVEVSLGGALDQQLIAAEINHLQSSDPPRLERPNWIVSL